MCRIEVVQTCRSFGNKEIQSKLNNRRSKIWEKEKNKRVMKITSFPQVWIAVMTKCFNQSCFIREVDCIESGLSRCLEKSLLAMEKVEMTEIIPKMSSYWMVMGCANFMCVCARVCAFVFVCVLVIMWERKGIWGFVGWREQIKTN